MAGNSLTPTGTPQFAPGQFGNAYVPNGGQYAWTSDFGPGGALFAVEGWAQVTASGAARTWFNTYTAVAQQRVGLGVNASNVLAITLGTLVTTVGSAMAVGWHHFAAQLVSGRWRVYVDGVQVYTISGSSNVFTWAGGFVIGRNSAGAQPWLGGIDEVRISTSERYPLGTTFTPPAAPFTVDASTYALYHFEADGTDGDAAAAVAPTYGGEGTLTTDGIASSVGAATYIGDGALVVVTSTGQTSAATYSGTGTLADSSRPSVTRAVAYSGSGQLARASTVAFTRAAAYSGSGALAVVPTTALGNLRIRNRPVLSAWWGTRRVRRIAYGGQLIDT
jgi:hypothetical protein